MTRQKKKIKKKNYRIQLAVNDYWNLRRKTKKRMKNVLNLHQFFALYNVIPSKRVLLQYRYNIITSERYTTDLLFTLMASKVSDNNTISTPSEKNKRRKRRRRCKFSRLTLCAHVMLAMIIMLCIIAYCCLSCTRRIMQKRKRLLREFVSIEILI